MWNFLTSITSSPAGYTSDLPVTVTITPSGTPVAGQSFTLTCQATTTLASPSYQWFNDGGDLVGNVSILTLNPLLESSTGEYSCQVTAGNGASQRFGCGTSRVVVQGLLTIDNILLKFSQCIYVAILISHSIILYKKA